MPVENLAEIPPERFAEIVSAVGNHRTLEEVITWGVLRKPTAVIEDVVPQDEFTHDVVVPWGIDGLYLVYDTT